MTIRWLPTIDSTNSEALRRLEDYPSGTVLAAYEQTAGRGQRGNTWFTEPGKNLTFSIVLKFPEGCLPASGVHWLNYLISDAVASFLQEQGSVPQVKWPNDVYVGRKKICGVLIENILQGSSVATSVIGVGVNVNQIVFPQLANATSLALCTGKEMALEPALERLVALFEEHLPLLFDEKRRESLIESYSALLFQKGVRARYRDLLTGEEFSGVIEGVEADGRLRIREGKRLRYYRFKEVGYIL